MIKIILNLTEIKQTDKELAGGKASSLANLAKLGVRIPQGFVILSTEFDTFTKYNKINLLCNNATSIRKSILTAKIPDDLTKQILASFDKLGSKAVAVRSSAITEDSATISWAGQLKTYLNTTRDNLLENIKICWASLFTENAVMYADSKGIQNKTMAVVIQEMIAGEVSGIAFSVHPVTGDKNQIIIEAGFGACEHVVSGKNIPEQYAVNKKTSTLVNQPSPKKVLSEENIVALSHIVCFIEQKYGFPCDIEWTMQKNKFYILQARPITALHNNI